MEIGEHVILPDHKDREAEIVDKMITKAGTPIYRVRIVGHLIALPRWTTDEFIKPLQPQPEA